MARLSFDGGAAGADRPSPYVNDPCCGTGRLLFEAGKVNPSVELVGQDIDPRCVKITAINMGLRSRYGWVVCGNTLTNEMRFAYRVGSFYNETPKGLRRGVIRELPINDTPVSVVAEEVRGAASAVISDQGDGKGPVAMQRSSIIEVPQWLARLEPMLARREHLGSERQEVVSERHQEQEGQTPKQQTMAIPPTIQGTLFD